jgi:hypothetical protein
MYVYIYIYMIIYKSLRDVRTLRYSTAGMVTPKGSMSTEGETLQVSVLPYRYSIAPFCCVCLGCYAVVFGSFRRTYELLCTYITSLEVSALWFSIFIVLIL